MMVMLIMVVLVVKIMVLVVKIVLLVKNNGSSGENSAVGFRTCGLGCGTGGRVLHSMFAKSQSPHSPEIHKQMLNCTNKNTDSSPMMTLPSLATLVAHHCSSLALWSLVQRW